MKVTLCSEPTHFESALRHVRPVFVCRTTLRLLPILRVQGTDPARVNRLVRCTVFGPVKVCFPFLRVCTFLRMASEVVSTNVRSPWTGAAGVTDDASRAAPAGAPATKARPLSPTALARTLAKLRRHFTTGLTFTERAAGTRRGSPEEATQG